MNMFWLLGMLFYNRLFLISTIDTGASARLDAVNIGAILSFNSSIGKVAKVAIEAAVDDVNSNPAVLNGTKLKLEMRDAKLSSGFLVLTSSYTASLTSILTVEKLSSPIKGIESLMANNDPIGYQHGTFIDTYLTEVYKIQTSRLVSLNSEEEYEKALKDGPQKGGVSAIVDMRADMELFLSTRCDFSIVGQEFTKMGWGFAFPRDSPLAIDMSIAILKLSENGELQKIHDKWLARKACRSEGAKEEVDRLPLKSFWGLFLICGLACFLALLFYVIKLVCQYMRLPARSQSGSVQSFLSFVKEKEDDVHEEKGRRRTMQG